MAKQRASIGANFRTKSADGILANHRARAGKVVSRANWRPIPSSWVRVVVFDGAVGCSPREPPAGAFQPQLDETFVS